jgi:hypothetical protein
MQDQHFKAMFPGDVLTGTTDRGSGESQLRRDGEFSPDQRHFLYISAMITRRLDPILHEFRCDVSSCDLLVRSSTAPAPECVRGEKIHMCAYAPGTDTRRQGSRRDALLDFRRFDFPRYRGLVGSQQGTGKNGDQDKRRKRPSHEFGFDFTRRKNPIPAGALPEAVGGRKFQRGLQESRLDTF